MSSSRIGSGSRIPRSPSGYFRSRRPTCCPDSGQTAPCPAFGKTPPSWSRLPGSASFWIAAGRPFRCPASAPRRAGAPPSARSCPRVRTAAGTSPVQSPSAAPAHPDRWPARWSGCRAARPSARRAAPPGFPQTAPPPAPRARSRRARAPPRPATRRKRGSRPPSAPPRRRYPSRRRGTDRPAPPSPCFGAYGAAPSCNPDRAKAREAVRCP